MSGTAPETLAWSEAPVRLSAIAQRRREHPLRPFVVGITGPTGAGKSTLARGLEPRPVILSTDDYLPDYEIVPFLERDDPRHADLPLLAANLQELRQARAADVPVWSFFTHRRETLRRVQPAPLVVVEGIHALHQTILDMLDLAVFVDATPQSRLRRLEARELAGERGWPLEHLREHFREVAEPAFAMRAASYRAAADFIVVNDDEPPGNTP